MRFPSAVLTLAVLAAGCGEQDQYVDPPDIAVPAADVSTGLNHPPELHKIGEKIVEVGKELVIEPKATDPDGGTLSFSLYGKMPDGATWVKDPPRFAWTPAAVLPPVYLTFVVTDQKTETDMENVKIEVVTESVNHAPVFQPVGEQYAVVGEVFTLQLQATDLDGDPLEFGVDGDLPPGSSIHPKDGFFSWTPPPIAEGNTYTVTFTVTDGLETANRAVSVAVLSKGQNMPPAFIPVGQQVAIVGKPYQLKVEAVDPDGDTLTFGVEDGSLPEGAHFSQESHTLTWVPTEAQAGTEHEIGFWVTDGNYKPRHMTVDVYVQSTSVTPGQCSDDFLEPNDKAASASEITVGTWKNLSICDTEKKAFDEDWFRVSLAQGQTLSLTVTFAHLEGDLDVEVYYGSNLGSPVAKAQSATDNEVITYGISTAGAYLIRVFGVGAAKFATHYELELSTTGLSCTDDDKEPNDGFDAATLLSGGMDQADGTFCPANLDFYRVPVKCGQTLAAKATYDKAAGNIDLYLYRESKTDEPVASATSKDSPDIATYGKALRNEDVFVLVTGKPPESTTNTYQLNISATGIVNCTNDAWEPNDDNAHASELTAPAAELDGLSLCCSPDWFYVPVGVGEGVLALVRYKGEPKVMAWLYEPNGKTIVATGEPGPEGLSLIMNTTLTPGTYYLVVEGEPGTAYGIETMVLESEGCTQSKGCKPKDQVCWKATGKCVSAQCAKETDCPPGQEMPCWEGLCLDGCTYDADCKLEHACKGFVFGRYCGNKGTKGVGEPCFTHEVCSGSSSCHWKEKGGYCTNIGCTSNAQCPGEADCVPFDGTTGLCAKTCKSNDDCRLADGFSCQPKKLKTGVETQVCLPIP